MSTFGVSAHLITGKLEPPFLLAVIVTRSEMAPRALTGRRFDSLARRRIIPRCKTKTCYGFAQTTRRARLRQRNPRESRLRNSPSPSLTMARWIHSQSHKSHRSFRFHRTQSVECSPTNPALFLWAMSIRVASVGA